MASLPVTIDRARQATGLSQRALAERTNISQATLSRIINGERTPTMPEIILIADATGCTVAQLIGTDLVNRVQYAARTTHDTDAAVLRERLLHFLEIDAYLEDQGITAAR